MRRRDGLTRKERRQFEDLVRTFYETDEPAPGISGEEAAPETGRDEDR